MEVVPAQNQQPVVPTNFEYVAHDNLRKILVQIEKENAIASLLFHANSPFLRVTPTLFTKLRLHDSRNFELDLDGKVVSFGRHDHAQLMQHFLEICGPSITTITVSSFGVEQLFGYDMNRYAKTLKEACVNARRVVLVGTDTELFSRAAVDSFICEFAGQVEELELRLPKNRKRLKHGRVGFRIAMHVVQQRSALKCFKYTGLALGNMVELMAAIGPTLEELHLTFVFPSPWENIMNGIRQHCRKLHTIMLDNPLDDAAQNEEMTFSNLLVSYGDQLVRANLHSLGLSYCRAIAAACPNLHATFVEKRHQFERVQVLGNRVESLSLRVREKADWNPLKEALKVCGQLNTLKLYRKTIRYNGIPLSEESVEAAFAIKLSHLQNVHIRSIRDSRILAYVAQGTGNLTSLTLYAIGSVGADDLTKIVEANPRLEYVNIVESYNRWDKTYSGMYITGVVECFLKCSRLETLKIHCSQSEHPDPGLVRALRLRLCNRGVKHEFKFWRTSLSGSGNTGMGLFGF